MSATTIEVIPGPALEELEAALRDPALEKLADGPAKDLLFNMAARLEYQTTGFARPHRCVESREDPPTDLPGKRKARPHKRRGRRG